MLPEFQCITCSQWGPGINCQGSEGSGQEMAAESCRVGLGQSDWVPNWERRESRRGKQGKGEIASGIPVGRKLSLKCWAFYSVRILIPAVRDKRFKQNEKVCLALTGSWEKLKQCFSNLMCTQITWGEQMMIQKVRGRAWDSAFPTSSKVMLLTTLWAPKPNAQTKREARPYHWGHQRTRSRGEAAKKEATQAWTQGTDQVPLPACGMALDLLNGVPWRRTLTYSL